MKRTALLLIMSVAACLGNQAFAAGDNRPIGMPDVLAFSMGGPHSALADGFSTIYNNPAGFVAVKPVLGIATVGAAMSGPIFNLADLVAGGATEGSAIATALTELLDKKGRLYAGADIPGPFSFGYVGNGLGFGFFNRTKATVNIAGNKAAISADEDILMTGGYAFRIPLGSKGALDTGIQAKGFLRGQAVRDGTLLDIVGLIASMKKPEDYGNALQASPFGITSGIGLDIGLRLSLGSVFAFGITARDIYTPTAYKPYDSLKAFIEHTSADHAFVYGFIPMNLSAGILLSPSLGALNRFLTSLKFLVDYGDIVGSFSPTSRNPILNIGVGAELTLLDVLSFRVGLYEGLLNAGLGLNLTYFSLNAAMYGTELAIEPGGRPLYNVFVGLEFDL